MKRVMSVAMQQKWQALMCSVSISFLNTITTLLWTLWRKGILYNFTVVYIFAFCIVKPENVELAISAVNNKACKGDVVKFICSADANPAVSSYQLFENDTAILDTNAVGMWNKTLTSEGVYFYKCVAKNVLGSMYSTSVMLTVNGNFFEFCQSKFCLFCPLLH